MLSTKIKIALVPLVIIILLLLGTFFYFKFAYKPQAAINYTRPINGNAGLNRSAIFSYNNARGLVEYALVGYDFSNVTNVSFMLQMYKTNPLQKIYLLNVGGSCYNCFNESALPSNLTYYLSQYGLIRNSSSFSYINMTSDNITAYNSIIIIPSGIFPASLMPSGGAGVRASPLNVINLLNRGDIIIYTGTDLSKSIDNGAIYHSSNATNSSLLAVGINTTTRIIAGTSNSFYFKAPTWGFAKGSAYGPIAAKNALNGSIIAFPNYPDFGWNNPRQMSSDIATLIFSRFWMPVYELGYGETNLTHGNMPIFATRNYLNNTPGINNFINNSYSLLTLNASNNVTHIFRLVPFRLNFENNGTLAMPAVIGIGQQIPISAKVNFAVPGIVNQPANPFILYHIEILTNKSQLVYPTVNIGLRNVSQSSIQYATFSLPPGYYVASLRDIQGTYYEQALFQIPYLKINLYYYDFKNGTFLFNTVNNNETVSGVGYNVMINNAYSENGTVHNGLINYTLPKGAVLKYGQQRIIVNVLSVNYLFPVTYSAPPNAYIPTFYIEFAIAVFVVIILNIVIRTPVRDEYYIDVQAFPPMQKTQARVPKSTIVDLFENINNRYHWRYMPLTPEEIRSGISASLRSNSMPMLITTENTVEILYTLANSGQLSVIDPYFMPKKWEKASSHDIEYLVVFRKLRDFAIRNAMVSTELDSYPTADMIMTSKNTQNHIFIYSSASGMKKLKITEGARIFVAFLNSETKLGFLDRLYNTYSKEGVKLRMAIDSGAILLIDAENLEALKY